MKRHPLRDEAWYFENCPPAQTSACYLYEYAIESEAVKAEVNAVREKIVLRAANEARYKRWAARNPVPPAKSKDHKAWFQRLIKACPYVVVDTRLEVYLTALYECSSFPDKHWLEIPPLIREQFAKRLHLNHQRWQHERTDLARRTLSIQSLEGFLRCPFGRLSLGLPSPRWNSGELVISFEWARSDRQLAEDFKTWLKENRPNDQPALEHTRASTSRRTRPDEHLKALAAFRLLRAFNGDPQKAREYVYQPGKKLLYGDDSAWLKAARKAEREIEGFGVKMLRSHKSVG